MSILGSVAYALVVGLFGLVAALVLLWTAGAIYFDAGRGRWFAWPLTLLWVAAIFGSFLLGPPVWGPLLALLVLFTAFCSWWFSQRPRNDRDWAPNFALLPRFEVTGDIVTVLNVRNTDYRSLEDYTPHRETRVYHLSNLTAVDAAVTYWGSPWLCHPMLIFDFGDEGRLCVSIEVRYRVGQRYSFFRSLYRQQEIAYVVCDERDAILQRSKYSKDHDVYLYRLLVEPWEVRQVFLEYVESTNALVERPRWYHGLTTNCTTSIYHQRGHAVEWDWRWLLNGKVDEMIYDHGRLDNHRPFAELKRLSLINNRANQAPREGFGEYIRRGLPTFQ